MLSPLKTHFLRLAMRFGRGRFVWGQLEPLYLKSQDFNAGHPVSYVNEVKAFIASFGFEPCSACRNFHPYDTVDLCEEEKGLMGGRLKRCDYCGDTFIIASENMHVAQCGAFIDALTAIFDQPTRA